MSFHNPSSPNEVRTVMQTMYDQYVAGATMFPRVRLNADPTDYPRKSLQVAKLLHQAWQRIDEDESYFGDALEVAVTPIIGSTENVRNLVVTRVGRNVVRIAEIEGGTTPKIRLGKFWCSEFLEKFEGLSIDMVDGRSVEMRNGQIRGEPDLVVVRRSP